MTTVTGDDDSKNIYTVPVGQCNQYISFEGYKYEEKPKSALIVTSEYIPKKEPSNISEKKLAYTLFLVHLPYSINKEIIIYVLYHPCS